MSDADGSRYDGLTCWVTGGASGVGAATAAVLGARGGDVWVVDRAQGAVDGARFKSLDISDDDAVRNLVDEAPVPDVLICCAGLAPTHPADRVMAVNHIGTRLLADLVSARMARGGAVAVVASLAAARWQQRVADLAPLVALDDPAAARTWCAEHADVIGDGYATSKEAITIWAMQRATALAAAGVRVNVLSPGPIETPMMRDFEEALGKQTMDDYPKPLGRTSTPAEQAEALAFLCSPGASYVSGANLFVDGAISASRVSAALSAGS